jgi:diadenosine tetraphosphate (Ap4A) HIT family hydrolase
MKENKSKCVFCEEVDVQKRKQLPRWIADLKVSTAFLCSNQICRGYTILTYNQGHYTELFQLEKDELIAYSQDLVEVAKAIYHAYHPFKINYELLGNVVPHLHWHIIPRQKTDPLEVHWPIWGKDYAEVRLSDEEYNEIVKEIRSHLS